MGKNTRAGTDIDKILYPRAYMGNSTGRNFLMGTGMEWYYPMNMYPLSSLIRGGFSGWVDPALSSLLVGVGTGWQTCVASCRGGGTCATVDHHVGHSVFFEISVRFGFSVLKNFSFSNIKTDRFLENKN
jgi:hypothetical protein